MENLKEIKKLATRQEMMLLIIFCGLQLFQSALAYVAVPFQFDVPIFQCHSSTTNESFICTENLACSNYSNSFKILKSKSSNSLTLEFSLICAKRFDKALIETLIILGQGSTCFFFSFFQLKPRHRKNIMFAAEIAFLFFVILAYAATSIQTISILLFLIQVAFQTFYINVYTYVNEHFNPKIKQVCTLLVSTSWGLSTIFYPIIYYIVQDWRNSLLFYTIIPSTILILLLYYFFYFNNTSSPNYFETDDKFYNFKAIFSEKTVKINFIFFTCIASIQYLCYTGANLSQDTIYGGLYFNMILFGFLELFAGLLNIKIIHLFEEKKQIKYFCIFNAFNYLMFILQPKENKSSVLQIFFIAFNLFGKLGFEMCWNVLLVYIQKLVPVYLSQLFFALMLSSVNILNPIVPYYIEVFKSLEVSPLIGFGIMYTASIFLIKYLKEYQQSVKESEIELQEVVLVDNDAKKSLTKQFILKSNKQNNEKYTDVEMNLEQYNHQ